MLCFAWPQWGNQRWSSSQVLVTSTFLSINNLFENLKRLTRKQHKTHKQNTCFYHESALHKGGKKNCQWWWKFIHPMLNLFTVSVSSHWIMTSVQVIQTCKFPIHLIEQKQKNTLQKQHTSDVVFLPNGSTMQRSLEQISLISWQMKRGEALERALSQRSQRHSKRVWQNHFRTALPHPPYVDPCKTSMPLLTAVSN